MSDILAVFAHPDDAAIFCGGTIIMLSMYNISSHICSITGSNTNHESSDMEACCKLLGCTYELLGLDSTSNLNIKTCSNQILQLINSHRPKILISHWRKDSHSGHSMVFDIVKNSTNKAIINSDGEFPREIYSCDTYWSWGENRTPFRPSVFCDITHVWEKKLEAIMIFKSKWIDRWIDMATIMGRMNGGRCGVKYAEGFEKSTTLTSLNGGEFPINKFIFPAL